MMNGPIFYVETRWGGSEQSPSPNRLRELIAELDVRDEEHPDTWMIHDESGWSVRLDEDRFAYLENPECETIKPLSDVTAETALALWASFAAGGPDAVTEFKWKQGSRPVSEQEHAERAKRARQSLLWLDRNFYDQLGPELSDAICRVQDCPRWRIRYSVFCKAHHFEQIRGRPCPFAD